MSRLSPVHSGRYDTNQVAFNLPLLAGLAGLDV